MKTNIDRESFPCGCKQKGTALASTPAVEPMTLAEAETIKSQAHRLVAYGIRRGLIRVARGVRHPIQSNHV